MFHLRPASEENGQRHAAPPQRFCGLHVLGPDQAAPAASPPPEPPRLLLVEQDPAMRAVLTRMLASRYRVEEAGGGSAAGQAAQDFPPELVIIDLQLHVTDELAFIRSLRLDPRTALVPIIVLATSANRECLLSCLLAGASSFLLKPFNMSELLTCAQLELELLSPLAEPRG